jgi:protein-arginine kinase activator protein McsA
MLQEALDEEDYEKATNIRDELQARNNPWLILSFIKHTH